MLAYMDAALERLEERSERSFADAVNAARLGILTAYDKAAMARWSSYQQRRGAKAAAAARGEDGAGLTGAALEHALRSLLVTNPDIVAVRIVPNG